MMPQRSTAVGCNRRLGSASSAFGRCSIRECRESSPRRPRIRSKLNGFSISNERHGHGTQPCLSGRKRLLKRGVRHGRTARAVRGRRTSCNCVREACVEMRFSRGRAAASATTLFEKCRHRTVVLSPYRLQKRLAAYPEVRCAAQGLGQSRRTLPRFRELHERSGRRQPRSELLHVPRQNEVSQVTENECSQPSICTDVSFSWLTTAAFSREPRAPDSSPWHRSSRGSSAATPC